MRILQLCPRLPFPLSDGGRLAMFELRRGLQRAGAEVRVLALNPVKHATDLVQARVGLAPGSVDAVPVDTSQRLVPLWRSLTQRLPYVVARFFDARFAATLEAELRSNPPDVVQLESLFMLPYLPVIRRNSGAVVVLRSLNVEYRIWEQLSSHEPRGWKRAMLQRVASGLRAYEIAHRDSCDAVLAISAEDADGYRELGFRSPVEVVPCGLDLERLNYTPAVDTVRTVCFLGSLDYLPNQEAVRWLLDDIWPRVSKRDPSLRLVIGGSRPSNAVREACTNSAVTLLADVPDAPAFLRASSLLVVPLQSGGGMRIKIVEAMAVGTPVLATTIGAGGIDAVSGVHLRVADDPGEFAERILDITSSAALRRSLRESGRSLVERFYDAAAIGQRTLAFYARLIERR